MNKSKEKITIEALKEAYFKRAKMEPTPDIELELDILEEVIRERIKKEEQAES